LASNAAAVSRAAVILIFALATPSLAAGGPCDKAIEIRVNCVLAADTNGGLDERLRPMGRQLQRLFHYSTYRLVSHQVENAKCGEGKAFSLPGGRVLHVDPQTVQDNAIKMQLMLFKGERPVMTTDIKLLNHGLLIIGGARYEEGMLIISIEANAPAMAGPENVMTAPNAKGRTDSPSPAELVP
jgi:hypothetical protein